MPASEYYMIVTIQQQFVWCLLKVSTKFRGKYLKKTHTFGFTLKNLFRHYKLLRQVSKHDLNALSLEKLVGVFNKENATVANFSLR